MKLVRLGRFLPGILALTLGATAIAAERMPPAPARANAGGYDLLDDTARKIAWIMRNDVRTLKREGVHGYHYVSLKRMLHHFRGSPARISAENLGRFGHEYVSRLVARFWDASVHLSEPGIPGFHLAGDPVNSRSYGYDDPDGFLFGGHMEGKAILVRVELPKGSHYLDSRPLEARLDQTSVENLANRVGCSSKMLLPSAMMDIMSPRCVELLLKVYRLLDVDFVIHSYLGIPSSQRDDRYEACDGMKAIQFHLIRASGISREAVRLYAESSPWSLELEVVNRGLKSYAYRAPVQCRPGGPPIPWKESGAEVVTDAIVSLWAREHFLGRGDSPDDQAARLAGRPFDR